MITLEEALTQRRAYNSMVTACSVKQVKIEMHHRFTEWRRATKELDELSDLADSYAIALFCELVPGQLVYHADRDSDTARIVRKLERDGQASLHLSTALGRDTYVNYAGPTSPVVVLDIPIVASPDDEETDV